MIEEIVEQQWNMMSETSLPRQRFFTPNVKFWKKLAELRPHYNLLIDCGTGNGDLPKEAVKQDIKMAGIDIIRRDGNDMMEVQIIPAHRMPFDALIWPLVCRPNHGGWCEALQRQARDFGSGFIYVGKPSMLNDDLDLSDVHTNLPADIVPHVGEEDETMAIWLPQ